MNGQVSYGLPRPGRALWAVILTILAIAIGMALLDGRTSAGTIVLHWMSCRVTDVLHGQVWRLLTSGVLTPPGDLLSLLFQLLGLYFLGADLERRWGGRRLVTFLAIAVVVGNLIGIAVGALAGLAGAGGPLLSPNEMFGPDAALTAIAVAWARENPEARVRLYFVIPVKGKYLLWFTIGACVYMLVRGSAPSEGIAALFGGVLVGLAFAGSPSFARRAWLQLRLGLLRRRSASLIADELLASATKNAPRRPRSPGGPPLRLVQGGLEDVLRKRKPPKDKRYLN